MNKALGIGLLVAGIVFLAFGFNESQSAASEISKVFTDSPTDRAMWFMAGGAVAAAVGLYLILTKAR
jgi:hypothetical protein